GLATVAALIARRIPARPAFAALAGVLAVGFAGVAARAAGAQRVVLTSSFTAVGYSPKIDDQRWDRVRVEFKGAGDSRIEVRLSDDTHTVQIRID
ncbi:MAG: hypothetical protein WCK21_04715, partial [Actinomycetota bacterium]